MGRPLGSPLPTGSAAAAWGTRNETSTCAPSPGKGTAAAPMRVTQQRNHAGDTDHEGCGETSSGGEGEAGDQGEEMEVGKQELADRMRWERRVGCGHASERQGKGQVRRKHALTSS